MSATDTFQAFLDEVRTTPGFVAASATDAKWLVEFENMERGLAAVDRRAYDDPKMLEILDSIEAVVCRRDLSVKERLLEVGKLLVQARDALKFTH